MLTAMVITCLLLMTYGYGYCLLLAAVTIGYCLTLWWLDVPYHCDYYLSLATIVVSYR
jgi:hypothetical protein